MSDFKIKNKKDKATDSDALKYKNFDEVMARSKTIAASGNSSLYMWAGGSALLVAVAVLTTLFINNPDSENHEANNTALPAPLVEPVYEIFEVAPPFDTVLYSKSGSQIAVPSNCFHDENGNPVNEPVVLKYREFHKPIEVIAAGIPMEYDTAGAKHHLESAGMFELLGESENSNIHIQPNKEITVDLLSHKADDRFNQYKLTNGTWEYIDHKKPKKTHALLKKLTGTDTVALQKKADKLTQKYNALQAEVEDLQSNKPTKPLLAKAGLIHLQLAIDKKAFPELAMYNNVLFEIPEDQKNFTAEDTKKNWHAELQQGKDDAYNIILKRMHEKITIKGAYPVVAEGDFDKAIKTFEESFKTYKKELASKQKQAKTTRIEMQETLNKLNEERIVENREEEQRQAFRKQIATSGNMVVRTFQINGFGTYNSDYPCIVPKGARVAATFFDSVSNEQINTNLVYLVELNTERMFTFRKEQFKTFGYNPESVNLIVGLSNTNQLYMYKPKKFKKEEAQVNQGIFNMVEIYKPFATVEELKDIIGI